MNRLELRIMNKQNMDKRNYAFDRTNFTLLAIGFAIVSTEQAFNPDIFSFRRIKVAPVVCFVGFISMIYAIIHKPKDKGAETTPAQTPSNNEEA